MLTRSFEIVEVLRIGATVSGQGSRPRGHRLSKTCPRGSQERSAKTDSNSLRTEKRPQILTPDEKDWRAPASKRRCHGSAISQCRKSSGLDHHRAHRRSGYPASMGLWD